MFLALVGRPHQKYDGTQFNGLLGIWPFVTTKSAQRSLKTREFSEQVIEPMNVDGLAFLAIMKTKVFLSDTSNILQRQEERRHLNGCGKAAHG